MKKVLDHNLLDDIAAEEKIRQRIKSNRRRWVKCLWICWTFTAIIFIWGEHSEWHRRQLRDEYDRTTDSVVHYFMQKGWPRDKIIIGPNPFR